MHFPHIKQNSLEGALYAFLKRHHRGGKLLLALSGGPDSLALFHLLLKHKRCAPLEFSCAHVNHQFRKESGSEEDSLKRLCVEKGVPLHIKRIESPIKGNLEEGARMFRLDFFKSLVGFEALLLGHQADDLAETCLKRLFEGAHLSSIGGMKDVDELMGLKVWRPLLPFPKKEITQWLDNEGHTPFIDQMNFDRAYLRARMRLDLIPSLKEQFGKEITSTLGRISQESYQLKELLDSLVEPLMNQNSIDRATPDIVLEHYLRQRFAPFKIVASRSQLQAMTRSLKEKGAKKQWLFEKAIVEIEKNSLSIKELE